MTSGTSGNLRELGTAAGIDCDRFDLVNIRDAAGILGITERQVFNRVQEGALKKIKVGRSAYFAVPKKRSDLQEAVAEVREMPEPSVHELPNQAEASAPPPHQTPPATPDVVHALAEITRTLNTLSDKLEQKERQLQEKTAQNEALSNQLMVVQNKLMAVRDQYQDEIQSLKERLDRLEAEQQQAPWWKFWAR